MQRQRRRYAATAVLLAALLVLGAAALLGAADNPTLVGLKVKVALLERFGVDALRVDVDVQNGTATLAGTVKKRETAELAEGIAKSVAGVRRVENDLKLAEYQNDPSKLDVAGRETERELEDGLLKSKVRVRLIEEMGADAMRIGTEAADTTVTLELPRDLSRDRREEAVRIAKQVPGVVRVLTVDKK